ncbi:hypothetical protein AMAG_12246 [Allomyces macrogynus ATCC 38327]|uniref:RraA-like protein n=1 Tax=Allomyces macrogynus (strain ATCC 38327) TaxID=578462 RepID=A0A0L0SX89_ALLM3|nr:hypothetical protein AMAG_12246 [Allomyces macrogynus ATCC 38327]|eukprot:KNE67178.1 hypothetical protein AMAG_12246 [Allomyces macrogynus ATCC 38327]
MAAPATTSSYTVDPIAPTVVADLQAVGACGASDALLKLSLPDGYLSAATVPAALATPAALDRVVVARAYTVKIVGAKDEPDTPTFTGQYVDSCPRGAAMVVSVPETAQNAIFGGLLAARARAVGSAALVTNGRVRDVGEISEFDFPVYASGTSIQSAQGRTRVVAVHVPIQIGKATVNPGDVVVADANGVAVIPAARVEEVATLARTLATVDDKCMHDIIHESSSLQAAFAKHRGGAKSAAAAPAPVTTK